MKESLSTPALRCLVKRGEHRTIGEIELLGVVAAVEELAIDIGAAFRRHLAALPGESRVAHCLRHDRSSRQRRKIHGGQPGVWAEQLHVEGVVLTAPEHAGFVRIPFVRVIRRPGVLDRAFYVRPISIQPRVVAEVFPLAIGFDDRTEVSVGTWTDDVEAGTERKPLAEGQAAARQLIIGELCFAERPLKSREKIGERLLIIPDVGAAPLAGTFVDVLALPSPDLTALQPDEGRGAEDAERAVDRVDDLRRQRRAEDRIAEGNGLLLERVPTAESLMPRWPSNPPIGSRNSSSRLEACPQMADCRVDRG